MAILSIPTLGISPVRPFINLAALRCSDYRARNPSLLVKPACLLSLVVPRLAKGDFTFPWLSRGCSSNSRGPWFPNITQHQVDSVEILDAIFKADWAVHLWSCSHEDCFQVRFVFERKDKGMVMIMAAVVSSVWCWLFFSITLSRRVYLLTCRILANVCC